MGGKRRVAPEIARLVMKENPPAFFDLCAGSGAVALGVIDAGFPAGMVTMIEAGPWGLVWKAVSQGSFAIDVLKRMFEHEMPEDPKAVAAWLKLDVALRPPSPETFLVLQAGSFGSVSVWWDGNRWRQANPEHNRGYNPRQYWEPGSDSKEKKPRGTIFNPGNIVAMMDRICTRCLGMKAVHGKIEEADLSASAGTIFCMDPPYKGDSGYGVSVDVDAFIRSAPRPLWVLEGRPLEGATHQLLAMRRGHNVNIGTSRKPDYLNIFPARAGHKA